MTASQTDCRLITAAFLLAGVIIDVIRLHSDMIAATVIAADYSRMMSMIILTITRSDPSIVEGIPVVELRHLAKNVIHYMKLLNYQ